MPSQADRPPVIPSAARPRWLFSLRPFGLPLLVLAAALLADFLFFRQWVGWTLGGFFALVGGLLLLRHARGLAFRASWGRVTASAALLAGLLVSMVLEPGVLAFLLALVWVGGLVTRARLGDKGAALGWSWVARQGVFWGTLWARPVLDAVVARRWHARGAKGLAAKGMLLLKFVFIAAGVVVPVVLGLVFLGLFASANPVIAKWLGARFDDVAEVVENITDYVTFGRLFLWFVVAVGLWGALRYRRPRARRHRPAAAFRAAPVYLTEQTPWGGRGPAASGEAAPPVAPAPPSAPAPPARTGPDGVAWVAWLGQQAVRLTVKTLVVLNAVFLAQLVLDARYLVLGSALPEGMTYAEYAHRGAYPLVVTALLAGGLVLAVFRPGGPAERSVWARGLVLFWIVQNVVLMLTAVWRLGMYVEVYSLTRLRVAAAVWMLMVGGGLVLLLWRIARRRDNRWLTGRTMGWGLAVLYLCCFVPFDPVIAGYNVDRCKEMGGPAGPIDVAYLETLGPDALPAIDRLLAEVSADRLDQPSAYRPEQVDVVGGRGSVSVSRGREPSGVSLGAALQSVRGEAADELGRRLSGWRGWTVRRAWLQAQGDGAARP